jgi:hypothetical protein
LGLNSNHSLVLTEDGEVYSFGKGSNGRLGHGDYNTKTTPTLINEYQKGTAIENDARITIKEIMDAMNMTSEKVLSDICFPGNTPIETDQGILQIKNVKAGVHTINGKEIRYVTQTKLKYDKELIKFKKDALGKNIPDKDTVIGVIDNWSTGRGMVNR